MSNLKVFKNEDLGEIRTTIIENKVWFVGKDVAIILGYSNPQKAIRDHVYQEDRTMNNSFTVNGTSITLVNESGIYSLILSSKMPNARKFKRWVTNEILPSIRKHGMYATEELILNPDLAIAAFTALKEERNKVQKLNKTIESQNQQLALQNQQITEMTSKASYYDVVLNCEDLVAISTISKDYGCSAKKMNLICMTSISKEIFGFYIRNMLNMDIQVPKLMFIKKKMVNIQKCIPIGRKKVGYL